MSKHIAILILVLFVTRGAIFSQTLSITGKIIEKTSKEPLQGATVALYQKNDSILVKGVVTNSLGNFELTSITPESYFITISFIGFIPYNIPSFFITNNKDIGIISLELSEIFLDEVSIAKEKSLFENKLDKKVYHVGKDIMVESSSATDILQNIPSVAVDINGGISLRNSSNITFFINGKPSAMLRGNASTVLAQIPASSIERIEIITNPSAKYRPDGVGGIINIVLKKEAKKGFNGQLVGNFGTENRSNGNLNLNYATEKVNFFGNYGIRKSAGTFLYDEKRYFKNVENGVTNSFYSEKGSSTSDGLSHTIFAGATWEINDLNNIEIAAAYSYGDLLYNSSASISATDSLTNPDYQFTNQQTNNELDEEGDIGLTYEHQFKNNEDHILSVEAAYSAFDESEDLKYNQLYTIPSNSTERSSNLIQKNGNQQEFLLDYTLPIGEDGELESGYAGELMFEDIRYQKDNTYTQFLFHQDIHALYLLYGHSFDQFSFKTGLRAEQTYLRFRIKTPSDTLISNDYFKLFPTVHIGYELNDSNQFSLSYSKRVNRPDSDELNPNLEYSDPRNAEAGNPELQPEQIHSLELGYQTIRNKFSFSTSLYYRYKYDAFSEIQTTIGDSVLLVSSTNLNTRQSTGLEMNWSGKISKKWDYSLTGDVFYTTIDASNLGYSANQAIVSGNLKAYSLIKLTKNTFLQLNAYYYFPKQSPQDTRSQFFYINSGLKQQLFKNKASLTLTATDIFHTYKKTHTLQSKELDKTSTSQRKLPVIYIGFTWIFNNYKSKDNLQYEGDGLKK